jgi:hypothetical protein
MSSVRRGFGDEIWRLAEAGDVGGLDSAAALLLHDPEGFEYEGHRALAFRHALQGRTAQALQELNEGWSEEWPTPSAYATDVARIHFLAGDCAKALTALSLDVRSATQWDGLTELVAACVKKDRALWREAIGIATAGETGTRKARAALAVLRARFA